MSRVNLCVCLLILSPLGAFHTRADLAIVDDLPGAYVPHPRTVST